MYNKSENNKFLKRVAVYNSNLVHYLLKNEVKTFVNFKHDIRNALQHRSFFHGMNSYSPSGENPDLLWIPYKDVASYKLFNESFQKQFGKKQK